MPRIIHDSLKRVGRAAVALKKGGSVLDDVLVFGGIGLVSYGAALERLSAGLIVAGLLLIVLAVGGSRAR